MSSADWTTLAVIFAAGLLLVFGVWATAGLRDREDRRALHCAPNRSIPGFAGGPAPRYLPAEEVAQECAQVRPLDGDERTRLRVHVANSRALPAGSLPGFVTDPASGWCVLDDAAVAWCRDGLGSERELLSLVRALRTLPGRERALVCVAPSFSPVALETLRANVVHGTLRGLAVQADDAAGQAIAEAAGAQPLTRTALVADYVDAHEFGAVDRWVSDAGNSWVAAGS